MFVRWMNGLSSGCCHLLQEEETRAWGRGRWCILSWCSYLVGSSGSGVEERYPGWGELKVWEPSVQRWWLKLQKIRFRIQKNVMEKTLKSKESRTGSSLRNVSGQQLWVDRGRRAHEKDQEASAREVGGKAQNPRTERPSRKWFVTDDGMSQYHVHADVMYWGGHNISAVIVKNPLMRKHQTNPDWGMFYELGCTLHKYLHPERLRQIKELFQIKGD